MGKLREKFKLSDTVLIFVISQCLIALVSANTGSGISAVHRNEDDCPCIQREMCPRVYGEGEWDSKELGDIQPCEDEEAVRCCGVTVSVVKESDNPADSTFPDDLDTSESRNVNNYAQIVAPDGSSIPRKRMPFPRGRKPTTESVSEQPSAFVNSEEKEHDSLPVYEEPSTEKTRSSIVRPALKRSRILPGRKPVESSAVQSYSNMQAKAKPVTTTTTISPPTTTTEGEDEVPVEVKAKLKPLVPKIRPFTKLRRPLTNSQVTEKNPVDQVPQSSEMSHYVPSAEEHREYQTNQQNGGGYGEETEQVAPLQRKRRPGQRRKVPVGSLQKRPDPTFQEEKSQLLPPQAEENTYEKGTRRPPLLLRKRRPNAHPTTEMPTTSVPEKIASTPEQPPQVVFETVTASSYVPERRRHPIKILKRIKTVPILETTEAATPEPSTTTTTSTTPTTIMTSTTPSTTTLSTSTSAPTTTESTTTTTEKEPEVTTTVSKVSNQSFKNYYNTINRSQRPTTTTTAPVEKQVPQNVQVYSSYTNIRDNHQQTPQKQDVKLLKHSGRFSVPPKFSFNFDFDTILPETTTTTTARPVETFPFNNHKSQFNSQRYQPSAPKPMTIVDAEESEIPSHSNSTETIPSQGSYSDDNEEEGYDVVLTSEDRTKNPSHYVEKEEDQEPDNPALKAFVDFEEMDGESEEDRKEPETRYNLHRPQNFNSIKTQKTTSNGYTTSDWIPLPNSHPYYPHTYEEEWDESKIREQKISKDQENPQKRIRMKFKKVETTLDKELEPTSKYTYAETTTTAKPLSRRPSYTRFRMTTSRTPITTSTSSTTSKYEGSSSKFSFPPYKKSTLVTTTTTTTEQPTTTEAPVAPPKIEQTYSQVEEEYPEPEVTKYVPEPQEEIVAPAVTNAPVQPIKVPHPQIFNRPNVHHNFEGKQSNRFQKTSFFNRQKNPTDQQFVTERPVQHQIPATPAAPVRVPQIVFTTPAPIMNIRQQFQTTPNMDHSQRFKVPMNFNLGSTQLASPPVQIVQRPEGSFRFPVEQRVKEQHSQQINLEHSNLKQINQERRPFVPQGEIQSNGNEQHQLQNNVQFVAQNQPQFGIANNPIVLKRPHVQVHQENNRFQMEREREQEFHRQQQQMVTIPMQIVEHPAVENNRDVEPLRVERPVIRPIQHQQDNRQHVQMTSEAERQKLHAQFLQNKFHQEQLMLNRNKVQQQQQRFPQPPNFQVNKEELGHNQPFVPTKVVIENGQLVQDHRFQVQEQGQFQNIQKHVERPNIFETELDNAQIRVGPITESIKPQQQPHSQFPANFNTQNFQIMKEVGAQQQMIQREKLETEAKAEKATAQLQAQIQQLNANIPQRFNGNDQFQRGQLVTPPQNIQRQNFQQQQQKQSSSEHESVGNAVQLQVQQQMINNLKRPQNIPQNVEPQQAHAQNFQRPQNFEANHFRQQQQHAKEHSSQTSFKQEQHSQSQQSSSNDNFLRQGGFQIPAVTQNQQPISQNQQQFQVPQQNSQQFQQQKFEQSKSQFNQQQLSSNSNQQFQNFQVQPQIRQGQPLPMMNNNFPQTPNQRPQMFPNPPVKSQRQSRSADWDDFELELDDQEEELEEEVTKNDEKFRAPKTVHRGFYPILPYSEEDPGPIVVKMPPKSDKFLEADKKVGKKHPNEV